MSWGLDTSGQSRKELVDVSEQFEEVECWNIIIINIDQFSNFNEGYHLKPENYIMTFFSLILR